MSEDEVTADLLAFIRTNLRKPGSDLEIDESTPLMETGILDSLKTAMLLNYIRDALHTPIPPLYLEAKNFQDVRTITSMIRELSTTSGR
ncbi:MAG TPA: phosphopantetheine-binding protein [Micromonosporaceae bacterium]|nr:phosphopantetheine-binding protein [Micromonosporaceae bacterium]